MDNGQACNINAGTKEEAANILEQFKDFMTSSARTVDSKNTKIPQKVYFAYDPYEA